MNTTSSSRAVSPVVGVILVVAITVAISGIVGVFVFDLGQSVSDSNAQSDIGTRTTYMDDGTARVQVVTGEADELQVRVDGSNSGAPLLDPSPGDSVSIDATPDSKITIIVTRNDERTIISSTGGNTGPIAPTDGLIAHWNLDGDAVEHVNGNDGVVSGATPESSGCMEGGCYSFDGTDDYIRVNHSSQLDVASTDEFTIANWVKTSVPDDTTIASIAKRNNKGGYHGYTFWANNNGAVQFLIDNGTPVLARESLEGINNGEWHHITVTRTGSTDLNIYIDGTLSNGAYTYRDSGVHPTFEVDAYIGSGREGELFHTPGRIDDVRIYDRALTSEEVSDLYNATK